MVRNNTRSMTNGMIPLMLFLVAKEYRRLQRKPLVTTVLLAVNTLIYLQPGFLSYIIPPIDDVWFNAYLIINRYDLKRFFLSAFYHLDESHLAFNMMSLLWKGIPLESSMGSTEFASMIAALLGLSHGISLLLAKSLLFFNYERTYYHDYSAGFSGVLFAMNVVLNSKSGSHTSIYGFSVPSKYAAWAELILIQLLVPNVSFLGHLSGILAGIIYVYLKATYTSPSPLTALVTGLSIMLGWPLKSLLRFWRPRQRGIFGRGRTGGSGASERGMWRCQACKVNNPGWLSECEVCGTGCSDDGSTSSLQGLELDISLDEIRKRRIQRFDR